MDLTPEQAKLFEDLHSKAYTRNTNRDDIARLTAENQRLSNDIAEIQEAILESVDLSPHEPMIYHHDNAYFVYNPFAPDEKIIVAYDVWAVEVVRPSDGTDDAPIPF